MALWALLMSTFDSRVRAQMVQPFQGFEDLITRVSHDGEPPVLSPLRRSRRLQICHNIKR